MWSVVSVRVKSTKLDLICLLKEAWYKRTLYVFSFKCKLLS